LVKVVAWAWESRNRRNYCHGLLRDGPLFRQMISWSTSLCRTLGTQQPATNGRLMDDERRCLDRRGEVSNCFVVYAEIGLVPHFPFVGPFRFEFSSGTTTGIIL